MIHDVHFSMVIDPQFSDYDVVNCRGNLSPGIMITGIFEHKMGHPCRKKKRKFSELKWNFAAMWHITINVGKHHEKLQIHSFRLNCECQITWV